MDNKGKRHFQAGIHAKHSKENSNIEDCKSISHVDGSICLLDLPSQGLHQVGDSD